MDVFLARKYINESMKSLNVFFITVLVNGVGHLVKTVHNGKNYNQKNYRFTALLRTERNLELSFVFYCKQPKTIQVSNTLYQLILILHRTFNIHRNCPLYHKICNVNNIQRAWPAIQNRLYRLSAYLIFDNVIKKI